ncbi:MAG: hypothetical protein M1829_003018 [Trizodia sp. TS-e1964]|nr:MAG: hypothetical protein M1829_003018 [Trizodia sp. TS-e1964]
MLFVKLLTLALLPIGVITAPGPSGQSLVVSADLDTLLATSQKIQFLANAITPLSYLDYVLGNGPLPDILRNFNSLVQYARSFSSIIKGFKPLKSDTDQDPVKRDTDEFFTALDDALTVFGQKVFIIGKEPGLNRIYKVPRFDDQILIALEKTKIAIDDFALELVTFIPKWADDVNAQRSNFDTTIDATIKSFSALSKIIQKRASAAFSG